MKHTIRSLLLALVLASCSSIVGETPIETVPSSTTSPGSTTNSEAPVTTQAPQRQCLGDADGAGPVATGSVAGDALFLSREWFLCADDVVVVGETDLNEVAAAAQLAAVLGGPLLHPHVDLAAELRRLEPLRVHLIGAVEVAVPPGAEGVNLTPVGAAEAAGEVLGATAEVRLPLVPAASTVVHTISAINGGYRVIPPPTPTTPAEAAVDPVAVARGLASPSGSEFVWLVDASQPVAALSAAATGQAVGASVAAYDPGNILRYPELGPALTGRPPSAIRSIGPEPANFQWGVEVLTRGVQVPGGGYRVLPVDRPRRYVAFYGTPRAPGLGALGEQAPRATLERMGPLLTEYAADGSQVIPTFEIIASVASAGPTDGDYSEESPPAAFDEWIRFAQENGMYVILDLQPGREDFLTQAKQYEELLELPFVGLALDPEWRLGPDQVHLRQIGQVNAAEVNTVVDWLADLVRDNRLPQKMLIVHQFKSTMIVDRETLKQRPELQMVIQMDGQGPIPTKDETYAFLTAGTDEAHWRWGWKNFFDEDSPETASPAFTIAHDPVPVFVSYQ
ncbi:MAG: hypothetical protein ACRDX9_14585 [Acidimicrobiia bacterium]